MSDSIDWQRHEEGTGTVSTGVTILRACHNCLCVSSALTCPRCGQPMEELQDGNAYVRLGKPSLAEIRQIVREEVHAALYDSPEHADDVPFGREMTDEEEAAFRREHPLLYTKDRGDRIFADEEDERVEAHIVTVKRSETPRTGTVDFTYEGVRYRGTVYEVKEGE